jgi:hypothetical protein
MGRRALLIALALAVVLGLFSAMVALRASMGPEEELRALDALLLAVGDVPPFGWLLQGVALGAGMPLLELNYDPTKGQGYVLQHRPGGRGLMVNFSLYEEPGVRPRGLVVGGRPQGFPPEANGVAFFDGEGWWHLWCNANEGIGSTATGQVLEPHQWQYLEGGLRRGLSSAELWSRHGLLLQGQPLVIERRVLLRAYEDFFTLQIKIINRGERPVLYDYAYGDEPWVGRYGSAEGDVGWAPWGLVSTEQYLDASRVSYAGFWDRGNPLVGEQGDFSGYANFIQWSPRADEVYFSNSFYQVRPARPLADRKERILNIVWKARRLEPGRSHTYTLRVGMARGDALSGLPRPPA